MSVGFATAFCVAMVCVPAQAQQSASAGQPQITFTKDVAPIFQESCQSCHRPGSIAPMSLLTYRRRATVGASDSHAGLEGGRCRRGSSTRTSAFSTFKDDRSLSDEEIDTIVKWVDAGAPRGNPADMPPPRKFDDNRYEWTLDDQLGREPDLDRADS